MKLTERKLRQIIKEEFSGQITSADYFNNDQSSTRKELLIIVSDMIGMAGNAQDKLNKLAEKDDFLQGEINDINTVVEILKRVSIRFTTGR